MDQLDRLYGRLVERLPGGGALSEPYACTVAEIYQELAPYRAVRTELGFGELPQYEHTLLRLLSGERGYARVELPKVREELRRELQAPHPILGIYRDYAAVGVRLRRTPRANGGSADPASPARESPPAPPQSVPTRSTSRDTTESPAPSVRDSQPPIATVETRTDFTERNGHRCPACEQSVPAGKNVRFCPFCGVAIGPTPCSECGTEVEPAWVFCVACGKPQPGRRPH